MGAGHQTPFQESQGTGLFVASEHVGLFLDSEQ